MSQISFQTYLPSRNVWNPLQIRQRRLDSFCREPFSGPLLKDRYVNTWLGAGGGLKHFNFSFLPVLGEIFQFDYSNTFWMGWNMLKPPSGGFLKCWYPKMDCLWKTLIKMDDLGGKPTIFGNTQVPEFLCSVLPWINSIDRLDEVLSSWRNLRDAFEIWRACTWRPSLFCCRCWSKVCWFVCCLLFDMRAPGGSIWWNDEAGPALCIWFYLPLQKSVVWLKRKHAPQFDSH